jgi:four helix bundle protein
MNNKGPIYDKSFKFAILIIKLFKKLETGKEFVLSKQLLRSGTGIGANVHEAVAAESRKDFSHKMAIALKEAHECMYWLRLICDGKLIEIDVKNEMNKCEELIRILTSIVKTTKNSSLKTKN